MENVNNSRPMEQLTQSLQSPIVNPRPRLVMSGFGDDATNPRVSREQGTQDSMFFRNTSTLPAQPTSVGK
jgi:hypothetical protein